MKFRIFGTIVVLAILGALAVVTGALDEKGATPHASPTAPADTSGLKPISIN